MIAAGPPSRARCLRCWRPASLCLCRRLTATPTRTRVVFLQHPRERAVRMGTARLAHLALADSELHVGVRFDDHPRVAALAAAPRGDVALLYPGPDATPIDRLATPPATLVVVDGTWITARKVVARSRLLRSLPRVSLAPAAPSAYRIRREPAPHCLSTVEAVIAALTALEGDPARFAALHAAFGELVATQVGYATARPAPYRHERKRRRPRRPSAAAELLATRFADLVLAQAEGNPHADGGPHELVQLLAVRPATGERFARVVRPRRPVGDHTPARLGLAPDRLDAGAPVEVARADWAAFVRPDDVLCSWGAFTAAVLRHEGFVCPLGVDVRGETARRLGRNPGGVEAACAALAAVADPPWAPGRGGRRVAALAALLARLRTESGVRFHPSERAVGGSHRWERRMAGRIVAAGRRLATHRATGGPMTEFRRILVPHDFSSHANAALKTAASLLEPGGRILVLHVVVPFTPVTDIPPAGVASYISPDELVSGAQRQLTKMVEKAVPKLDGKVDLKVEIGDPYQRIMQAARGMDAIVMSTAGRTGLSHLLIGSVTEKVVRHSPIPVLTLRPEAGRKAAAKARKR